MKILAKKLSIQEFEEYVQKKDFGTLPPTFLVIHHTWKPTQADWKGLKSIEGLKAYYEGLGWTAGPHLFIGDDGIWLFTDMYDVGIHAGVGNGTLKSGYSIGIEVVGNYDDKIWDGETYKNTIEAIKILCEKLNVPQDKIRFHRDYSSKSCPGHAITKDWLLNQLNKKEMSGLDEKNVKKVLTALGELFGKDYGSNPNDDETKDILNKLAGVKKDLERFKNLDGEIEKMEVVYKAQKTIHEILKS